MTHVKELSKLITIKLFFVTLVIIFNNKKVLREENRVLSSPNIVIDHDQKIDSPTDICNAFNSFLANGRKKLAAVKKLSGKFKNHKDYLGPRQQISIFLNPKGEFKVLEEKNISFRNSPGYINISVDVLKRSKFKKFKTKFK